jgi:hypothetical protein
VVGHAWVQNVRRGHYELGVEAPASRRPAAAFADSPWRSDRLGARGDTVLLEFGSANATEPSDLLRRWLTSEIPGSDKKFGTWLVARGVAA